MERLGIVNRGAVWRRAAEILLVFGLLLLTIRVVTQQSDAPQLILLLLLYIITANFSLPPSYGSLGLIPVAAVSSLLLAGMNAAVLLTAISLTLAELARPLWRPIWDSVNLNLPAWHERIGIIAVHSLALAISGSFYTWLGGRAPLASTEVTDQLAAFAGLVLGYGGVQLLLLALVWYLGKRPFSSFVFDHAPSILATSLLAQPFAILGAITFVSSGIPLFVVFCVGVTAFSIMIWLSWQRRYVARRQLEQFARLNESSLSLREKLDLPTVIRRTYQEVGGLLSADQHALWLIDDSGTWQQPEPSGNSGTATVPDDLTTWVASRQQLLNLHSRNIHYAARHQLEIPSPRPTAWLGVPLYTPNRTVGVLVLQRFGASQPFGRWHQEMLLALGGQVSAAIENARRFEATLRLYNQTDAALAERLEQLQALLNSVQEGILMIDIHSRIVLVNPRAATLLQQPIESLRHQTLTSQMAAARLGYTAAAWREKERQLQQQQPGAGETAVFPTTLATASGSSSYFVERAEAAVHDRNGQLMGWLMVLRDVTEERQLAEQRTDLIRMIVHDLRNPVTTIMSTVRAVADQLDTDLDTKNGAGNLLSDAQQSCTDMLDMVDSLMDINRMEAGQLQPDAEAMRLPPLVHSVTQRIQPLSLQRQVTLHVMTDPALPPVWADAEMIRRVLINLLDNGLKYTPAGGQISIKLTVEPPDSGHDPGIRCTISDTGPGIPPEFREEVFDRFMRTNVGGAQVRGTGLGLTFCKIAVEAHNGRIWAEDTPEGGGRFVFTLPGIPQFDHDDERSP